jgi:hypothetical protein
MQKKSTPLAVVAKKNARDSGGLSDLATAAIAEKINAQTAARNQAHDAKKK